MKSPFRQNPNYRQILEYIIEANYNVISAFNRQFAKCNYMLYPFNKKDPNILYIALTTSRSEKSDKDIPLAYINLTTGRADLLPGIEDKLEILVQDTKKSTDLFDLLLDAPSPQKLVDHIDTMCTFIQDALVTSTLLPIKPATTKTLYFQEMYGDTPVAVRLNPYDPKYKENSARHLLVSHFHMNKRKKQFLYRPKAYNSKEFIPNMTVKQKAMIKSLNHQLGRTHEYINPAMKAPEAAKRIDQLLQELDHVTEPQTKFIQKLNKDIAKSKYADELSTLIVSDEEIALLSKKDATLHIATVKEKLNR